MEQRNSSQDRIEAAVFRRLVSHLRTRSDVQNIDLMNLAGFCRNCLSKWYVSASADEGEAIEYEEARKLIYGIGYHEWKVKYQTEPTVEQLEEFERRTHRTK
ncbi:MAG: DUF1244 domain-containing protein [Gammaproteobacteria bacterium]|nr:DUF1244 domain-containing protein [Gammaproteobacteria bacterium]